MMADGWLAYDGAAALDLAERYESVRAEDVHSWILDLFPAKPGAVLDVGAGSGRDAAWLAGQGYDVVAVEPSAAMLAEARRRHADTTVRWVCDSLPSLAEVYRLGLTFDVILLSAVWMHVSPADRQRAFRKLMNLLRPGGLLVFTLRQGTPDPKRSMHPVSAEELVSLAKAHGAAVVREAREPDRLGRADVTWAHVALRLPDDGTGALPLFRHVILNDSKSATYKLGLLRAVARAADGAQGMACPVGDEFVSVPLGLIALLWLRLYKPLVAAELPQLPNNRGPNGLGFAKDGWWRIATMSPLDLRVGARFGGVNAEALHMALRDAADTIVRMPANFLTWPGTAEQVMKAIKASAGRSPFDLLLNESYLRSFGEMLVPTHLWRALARYDAWIEPALVAEWVRLMHGYAEHQGRILDAGVVAKAMEWAEPARDVGFVRQIALGLMKTRTLYCVWTGKKLSEKNLDIDHCMPWSAWPCEDLWNLMPADRSENQHHKRQRLPSGAALAQARDNIVGWWETAYARRDEAVALRFYAEANSSLPIPPTEVDLDIVFDGVGARRMALRADQQVEEWTP